MECIAMPEQSHRQVQVSPMGPYKQGMAFLIM
jgi:hypothetical protein